MKLIELNKTPLTILDSNEHYPLQLACKSGQSDRVIMKLIEVFPDAANIPCGSCHLYSAYALHFACRFNSSDTVIRKLIDLYPTVLQQKDLSGSYPIHYAIENNHSNEIIKHILNVDPLSIQRQNEKGKSPLHMRYPDRLNSIFMESMKINSDIPINMKDNNGKTPLHYACIFGKEDVVEFILQYPGMDVNVKHESIFYTYMYTPLHEASNARHINIVRQLLDHPCIRSNENDINNKTPSPLDMTKDIIKGLIEDLNPDLLAYDSDDSFPKDSKDTMKQKLSDYLEIEKLLEDFSIKRRWQAFVYILRNNNMKL